MSNIKQLSKLAVGLTVLYVEDELEARESMCHILKNIFTNVLAACDGEEGISLAKDNKIDIIISDINMPKCNGLDMIEEIRKIYPQVPAILITAFEDHKFLLKSINLGINKYAIKPIKKDKLFEDIEEILYLINNRKKSQNEHMSLSKNIKMIAISKLLDNLTHQWRQSLSVISMAVGGIILQDEKKVGSDEIQYLLNQIDTTVINMDKELQDVLLDFENEHKKIKFNLKEAVDETLYYFHKEFDKYNIKIINEIENINLFNSADSFSQILHHIIENSIDALTLNDVKSKYIKISSYEQNEKIIVDIVDNGGGILESIQDEIFEPYSTTKHQYIGTGLGLYIAYILATKSLSGTLAGNNIKQDGQECAKFSISLLK
ncbi:MAG: response regulator [Arcobacteraceae bacterium]|nr:response regulator [Arcobacteraceae bacterium]